MDIKVFKGATPLSLTGLDGSAQYINSDGMIILRIAANDVPQEQGLSALEFVPTQDQVTSVEVTVDGKTNTISTLQENLEGRFRNTYGVDGFLGLNFVVKKL